MNTKFLRDNINEFVLRKVKQICAMTQQRDPNQCRNSFMIENNVHQVNIHNEHTDIDTHTHTHTVTTFLYTCDTTYKQIQ